MGKSYLALLAPLLIVLGCNDDSGKTADLGVDMAHAVDPLAILCTDTIDDVYKLPTTALPAFDASRRGDIFRCAFDRALTAAQVNATLTALQYTGPAVH